MLPWASYIFSWAQHPTEDLSFPVKGAGLTFATANHTPTTKQEQHKTVNGEDDGDHDNRTLVTVTVTTTTMMTSRITSRMDPLNPRTNRDGDSLPGASRGKMKRASGRDAA